MLIVEDEAMIAMLLELILENADLRGRGAGLFWCPEALAPDRAVSGVDAAVVIFVWATMTAARSWTHLNERGVPFLLMTGQVDG